MSGQLDLVILRDFGIALLIGALVGIDREKRKPEGGSSSVPGVRTFMLLALLGAMGAWLSREMGSPWVFVGVIVGVSGMIVAGYVQVARQHPEALGLTTELAGLGVCMVGGLAMVGQAPLAVALGIGVSALLTFKQPIHGVVRKLGAEDLTAGLKLLIATFIVLPVLPHRAVDPWGVLNPYQLWWLVILISSLSLVGYVATRWLGPERGLAVTGLTGGLVSSTAVTLTFARRSREEGVGVVETGGLAVGIMLAWLVMAGRGAVEVAVVHRALLGALLVPLGAIGLATVGLAVVFYVKSRRRAESEAPVAAEVPLKNPFSLTSAIKFAAFFALVLLVVKVAQGASPGQGVYWVAILAGGTDVDAITLSMAAYAKESGEGVTAVRAIILAALSNTVVKAGMVALLGGAGLRRRILWAAGVICLAGGVGLWVT